MAGWIRRNRWGVAIAVAAVALAVVLALVVLARGMQPAPSYTPDTAGVVVSVGPGHDRNTTHYVLSDGRELDLDLHDQALVPQVYGGTPNIGDLLLAGTDPQHPWIARVPKSSRTDVPASCYGVEAYGSIEQGGSIQTAVGLRLHKAPGFEGLVGEPAPDGHYGNPGRIFCLNAEGLVTALR